MSNHDKTPNYRDKSGGGLNFSMRENALELEIVSKKVNNADEDVPVFGLGLG